MSTIYTIPNRRVVNGRSTPIQIKDEFTLPSVSGKIVLKLTEVPSDIPGVIIDSQLYNDNIVVRDKDSQQLYTSVSDENQLSWDSFLVNENSFKFGYISLEVSVGNNDGRTLEIFYNGIGSIVRAEDINELITGDLLSDGAIKDRHISNSTLNLSNINSENITSESITINGTISNGKHAVTKEYVYGLLQGLDLKGSVRVATTSDLDCNFSGNTLTSINQIQLVVDSVSLEIGDRVLVKDQTDKKQNGIYVVTATGGSGASFILDRADDFDSSEKVTSGAYVGVEEGPINGKSGWVLTTPDPIELNVTELHFEHFYHAGASWVLTGNNIYNNNSGNVGIGTNTPSEKLHVAGNIKSDNNIEAGSIIVPVGNSGFGTNLPVEKISLRGNMSVSSGAIGFNRNPSDGSLPDGGTSSSESFEINKNSNKLEIKGYDNTGTYKGNLYLDGSTGKVGFDGTLMVGKANDGSEKKIHAASSENCLTISGGADDSSSAVLRLYGSSHYPPLSSGFRLTSGSDVIICSDDNKNIGIGGEPAYGRKVKIYGSVRMPSNSSIEFEGLNGTPSIGSNSNDRLFLDGGGNGNNNIIINAGELDVNSNILKLGNTSMLDSHRYIYAENGSPSNPYIRYNPFNNSWEFSDDGVTPRTLSNNSSAPQWIKFTKSYSDFASSPSSILWFIPAGGILHAVKIKHSVAFSGVGVSYFKISLGVNGGFSKYASPFEVTSAPSQTNFYVANSFFCEDSTGWNVWVLGQAYDSNMAIMTNPSSGAGQVDIWLLVSMAS